MIKKRTPLFLIVFALLFTSNAFAQKESYNNNKFKQLKEELPTPNVYRTGAGAPGHQYYQQQADYVMSITLDDENQRVYGEQTVTYTNNSPDALDYLWIQMDQNVRSLDSDSYKIQNNTINPRMTFGQLQNLHREFDGGFKLEYVKDSRNRDVSYTVNKTMMRINLDTPLRPGQSYSFKIKWWYNINDRLAIGGRSGYEYFPKDDNYLYTIAQFYPRMAVYNDVEGWQNKQFLGRGEFALPFGDYKVSITVPSDHLVAASGELQNPNQVLPADKRRLYEQAKTATEPVIIYSQEEAIEREGSRATDTKTWVFEAENVRDFGFATSRKFIWDAMGVQFGDRTVMAMSMYPKEGNPLWERYSTRTVAHTLEVYSKYTFDYPYPVAYSIHAKSIGMEYPMICFNFGRPEEDGTYSSNTKYRMIGVIIHEVGHNWFPMIVNSDERQWTWMDEGLNTFLQFLTEQELERDFPSRRGPAANIVPYMAGDKNRVVPIMTNSESISGWQFGSNAYGKPAAGLNILRETVMGPELFDYAFKQYANRWKFKHPTPADFFRTMEDASAVDLDWFWRGWFFTNDHVDQKLESVKLYEISSQNPDVEKPLARAAFEKSEKGISTIRDDQEKRIAETLNERDEKANDFYTKYDRFEVNSLDRQQYQRYLSSLTPDERAVVESGYNYFEITVSNVGELVMPIILKLDYEDGTSEVKHIPAEIWRVDDKKATKVFYSKKKLAEVTLDPFIEIADIDRENNYWPAREIPTRFQLFKQRQSRTPENTMQRIQRANQVSSNSNN